MLKNIQPQRERTTFKNNLHICFALSYSPLEPNKTIFLMLSFVNCAEKAVAFML